MRYIITAICISTSTFSFSSDSKDYVNKSICKCSEELKLHMNEYDHVYYLDYLEITYLMGKIRAYEDVRDNG